MELLSNAPDIHIGEPARVLIPKHTHTTPSFILCYAKRVHNLKTIKVRRGVFTLAWHWRLF